MAVLSSPNLNPNHNPYHNPIHKTLTLKPIPNHISNPLPSGTGCKLWSVVVGSGRW